MTLCPNPFQILEEIERELGVSFPPAMANIERPQRRIHSSLPVERSTPRAPPIPRTPPTPSPQVEEMGSLRRKVSSDHLHVLLL